MNVMYGTHTATLILNNLTNVITKHEKSQNHLRPVVQHACFGSFCIDTQLDIQLRADVARHNEMVKRNREILKRLIDVTCFLAMQGAENGINVQVNQGYRLDFNLPSSKTWGGCPATIVPQKDKHVWGAVWEIDIQDLEHLDKHEGVEQKLYSAIQVAVESPDGQIYSCRCYQMCVLPEPLKQGAKLPLERQPSGIYMDVIILGATESGLPEEYIQFLKNIPHNDFRGDIDDFVKKPLHVS